MTSLSRKATLSIAEGVCGNGNNTVYNMQRVIDTLEDLRQAVMYDHVAGTFRNNHRSIPDFINADCIIMDCDNDHSNNPADWLTTEKLAQRLPNVPYCIVYSRNHMKEKNGKSPRPKFHVYLMLSRIFTSAEDISGLKAKVLAVIPEFDRRAKDAARFIFGVESPVCEYHEGTQCIDEYTSSLPVYDLFTANSTLRTDQEALPANTAHSTTRPDDDDTGSRVMVSTRSFIEQAMRDNEYCRGYFDFIANPGKIIPEGDRHNILLQIADGALMNEDIDSARKTYERACRQCRPPHDKHDIAVIWHDAKEYTRMKKEQQQTQQEQQQAGRKKSKPINLAVVEKLLKAKRIGIRIDVITKATEVPNLPEGDDGMLEGYSQLNDYERQNVNGDLLIPYLTYKLKNAGYSFNDGQLKNIINSIAKTYSHNPVRDMLTSHQWDGEERIKQLLKVLGVMPADNNDITTLSYEERMRCRLVLKWLIQALALALNDKGEYCQAFALVLQGAQGAGKTSFFRKLAVFPEWFKEATTIDMRSKDSKIESISTWICELGELDSTIKKEQPSLKGHLTAPRDFIRMPYGDKWDWIPRHTCFCATVNPAQVLRDETGSRRFVIIHVDAIDKDFIYNGMTQEWCKQLWREVYECYYMQNPSQYFLTDDEQAFSEKSNRSYREPLDAEIEIRDGVDWEDTDTLDWRKASEVMAMLKLERYGAKRVSKALQAIIPDFPHCKIDSRRDRHLFYMPRPEDKRNQ